jgi:hypothetical protein
MIDPDLAARLDAIEQKVAAAEAAAEAAFNSADKVRKWIFWTGVVTVVLFVLPLIGLAFALPSFLNYYTQIGTYSSLIQ